MTAQAIVDKLLNAKSRNSKNVRGAMVKLEADGIDVQAVYDALDDYQSIERSDYDCQEDYLDDRESTWDEVVMAIEALDVDLEDASYSVNQN